MSVRYLASQKYPSVKIPECALVTVEFGKWIRKTLLLLASVCIVFLNKSEQ